jgi:hypothetical protein
MAWFDIPKAMRAALLADSQLVAIVGERVHYQEIPSESEYPHVWFTRTGRDRTDFLDGEEEMTVERFSFEVVSDRDCEAVIDRLVEVLEAFIGQVEDRDVQMVSVDDADDDYIFKSVGEGEPDYLHALQVTVYSVEQ